MDSKATPRGCLRAELLYFTQQDPGNPSWAAGNVLRSGFSQGSMSGLRAPLRAFRCLCKIERFGRGTSEAPPASSASWWGLWGTSTGLMEREPPGAQPGPG